MRLLRLDRRELDHLIAYVYYWYSLLYLIARTAGLFMFAHAINDAAAAPLQTIRRLPTAGWGPEVARLAAQIVHEAPMLSGMKFFYLTRSNLLTVSVCEIVRIARGGRLSMMRACADVRHHRHLRAGADAVRGEHQGDGRQNRIGADQLCGLGGGGQCDRFAFMKPSIVCGSTQIVYLIPYVYFTLYGKH